jgi:hypothetical protein
MPAAKQSQLDHRIATHEGMRLSAERRADKAEQGRLAAQLAVRYVRKQLADLDSAALQATAQRLLDHADRESRKILPDPDLMDDLTEAARLLTATRKLSI